MTDKREDILVRLQELMTESYVAATTVVRNRALTKQDDRPAVAILDGDEQARLTGDNLGRGDNGRIALLPQIMTMTPEIFVLPKSEHPKNETVGPIVNDFRMTIVRVVANDPILREIVGPHGSIAYMRMITDLKSGMALDGQCRLDFNFTYVLDPSPI